MTYLQHRRRLKIRLQEARLKQPSRTSAEAYAGMERMRASVSGMLLNISGSGSSAGQSSQGLNLPVNVAPTKEGGREHDVHFDDASERWLKFTKPSSAGYAVEMVEGALMMVPASPLQYLERWKTHNHLFFDDVELVGVRSNGPSHRIVVSQQDWGDDTPTWEQIERAMVEDYRLERLPTKDSLGGYEARLISTDDLQFLICGRLIVLARRAGSSCRSM